ncbi:MAG: hypothetical protein JRN66_08550, partial [Nitrososphaerota archaeon]|nr:hypothetical protein [Nitrososphaerota archaeon]
ALIPPEAQLSGLERRQNSAMGSSKTVQTVRDEGEKEAKVRTPQALAVGVCQLVILQPLQPGKGGGNQPLRPGGGQNLYKVKCMM